MMPALTAEPKDTPPANAPRVAWLTPEKGFSDWTLQQDLVAADRMIAQLEQDLRSERGEPVVCENHVDERSMSISHDDQACRSHSVCLLRSLFPFGSAALLVGVGLLAGSLAGDFADLWDWGLAAIVMGQTALLVAALSRS